MNFELTPLPEAEIGEKKIGENETQEKIPSQHGFELAHQLEQTEDEHFIRENLGEMLSTIESELGVKFVSNVNDLYKGMREENCLVRVERLSRVLETVELSSLLHIADETETHYANAVIPNAEGIKIALSEGQAPGPLRIMVGFGKTIIGFKADNLEVKEIDFNARVSGDAVDSRDQSERKFLCRHVSGDLKKEDIRYIVIRIPSSLMKDELLTSEELQKKPKFAFRGIRLN